MFLPVTQKLAAKGKAVPTLWRDCSWRVRVFVRTRLGARRPMSINPLLIGRTVAGLPGLKIWRSADAPVRANAVSGSHTRRSRLTSPGDRQCSRVPLTRSVSRRHGIQPAVVTRFSRMWAGPRRLGQKQNRIFVPMTRAPRTATGFLQLKSPAPLFPDASERLKPLLAFASSQLGGLAMSHLRIYSVFECSLPSPSTL